MSKIGRPSLEESKRKQVVATLRLDQSERDELETAAQANGQKFSTWARKILLEAARQKC